MLVASVLGRSPELVDAAVDAFCSQHGAPGYLSDQMAFPWTSYYQDELGPAPSRRILAVETLLDDPAALCTIKRTSIRLEVSLGCRGRGRQVNIDPGTLDGRKLVLASTKPRGHRLYMGQGIYGELTLLYNGEGLAPLPWTYPDYADSVLLGIFENLRRSYLLRRQTDEARCNP